MKNYELCQKNHLVLLALALLATPAISVADNLIDIQDPAEFIHKETVEVSIYEGDPATGTKSGPQQCFALKIIGENAGWVAMKKPLEIDSSVRYHIRASVFSEGDATISVNGSSYGAERLLLCDPSGHPLSYTLKSEDGSAVVKAPTGRWVLMEAIVGPGEAMDWPPGAVRTNIGIGIKAEPGTVVYLKNLSAEEVR